MTINLADLGITTDAVPGAFAEHSADQQAPASTTIRSLVPGSIVARTLYSVLRGQPVVVVNAPPGAGKTTLLLEVIDHLMVRSEMSVRVCCPTRNGMKDVSRRLIEKAESYPTLDYTVIPQENCVQHTADIAASTGRTVSVTTIASAMVQPPEVDLLIVDEAYQATVADLLMAADRATQVLLVGDPGQIGPVVTYNTLPWNGLSAAPHHRAPDVFIQRQDAEALHMDATYRLGKNTVEVIAPLYDFAFVSRRPKRRICNPAGTTMPEIRQVRLTREEIADADKSGPRSTQVAKVVAEIASSFVGLKTQHIEAETGATINRALAPEDIAIVVSRNATSAAVEAYLASLDLAGITIGTADRLQGGQWQAVVALDPLVGPVTLSDHQLSLGRLCVMLSRHMTHLTWIHDGRAVARLQEAAESGDVRSALGEESELAIGARVRQRLLEVAVD
jgi:hypothetical protein